MEETDVDFYDNTMCCVWALQLGGSVLSSFVSQICMNSKCATYLTSQVVLNKYSLLQQFSHPLNEVDNSTYIMGSF